MQRKFCAHCGAEDHGRVTKYECDYCGKGMVGWELVTRHRPEHFIKRLYPQLKEDESDSWHGRIRLELTGKRGGSYNCCPACLIKFLQETISEEKSSSNRDA